MAIATLRAPALRPAASELPAPAELPRELAGWTVIDGEDPGLFLGNVHFSHRSSRIYERDGGSVSAFLGWDDRRRRIRSLLSEKNAVPGAGWDVEQRRYVEIEVAPAPLRMERLVARRFASRWLALHGYRGTGSVLEETLRALLALDQPGSPFARPDPARMLRVGTAIGPGPDGLHDAEERVRKLLEDLGPELAR